MNKRSALLSTVSLVFILLATLGISLTAQARSETRSVSAPSAGTAVFINEIHYDNTGADSGEGVEVAGPAGMDLANWVLVPYNGNGGGTYTPIVTLTGILANQQNGFGTAFFTITGLQNGSPDGIALVNPSGVVIQFLSYEGVFTATNGPAIGIVSTDIGVTEDGTNAAGTSLQLQGTGSVYEDFTWAGPSATTYNAVNTGQTFALPVVEADLGVAKTAPNTALAGEAITYTVALSNTGSETATLTVLTDTLPPEVTFVTYTTALTVNFSQPDATTLVWDLGDVAPGANDLTIQVQGVISANIADGTFFTNTVTASTSFTETNLDNNLAQAATLIGSPDLVVVKEGPAVVSAGDDVVYTLTYSNVGTLVATNVQVIDTLPAAMAYVTNSLGTGNFSNNTVTWTLGDLNAGASGTIVLTASAVYAGDWPNTAVIEGGPADSDPGNNISTITTTIQGSDPFIAKSGPSIVFSGELITYTIVYGNHGTVAADVTLTDTLPISVTTSDIAYDDSGLAPFDTTNTRSWTTTLAAGDRFTFTLALTVPTVIANSTRITNTIEIATAGLGSNPIDDTDNAAATVYQVVPIAQARAGTNGQIFPVEGQVIYAPNTFGTNEWGVQDASGGISVFYSPPPAVALGDRVRLVATRGAFSGQAQLASPVYYFANLGSGPQVQPRPFTTGQVASGASEGWLSVISGTVSGLSTCTPGVNNYQFNLDDGSGATVVFVDRDTLVDVCALGVGNGDRLMVTGFSTQFNGTFEVKPRFPADAAAYPTVTGVFPADNAADVAVTTNISATFNQTMTNVSDATFTLHGPSGAVAGTVSYDAATRAALFDPTADLAYGARYTATLSADLAASSGLTLTQDYVWTFTTHQLTPDLTTSTKGNSINGAVRAGEWVTYTITLNNTGDGDATAVVTDVLGSYYLVANSLDFTQPTTGTLTWTGVVTAGQSVAIQFVAQVKGPQALPLGASLLLNSAQVSDGVHPPVTLDDLMPPTMTIYGVYLPLIKR